MSVSNGNKLAEGVVSRLSHEDVRAMASELFAAMLEATKAGQCPQFRGLLESWVETADLKSDATFARELKANLEDVAKGKGVLWADLKRRLPTR